jgi:hypothetical protein
LITLQCYNCENIIGYSHSDDDEGNRMRNWIDDPVSVRVQIFIRCQSCFAKFQHGRPDIAFTHKVTPVR